MLAGAERALEIQERRLGPDHVLVGRTLGNLGVVLTRAGEVEAAEDVLERVLALYEEALGPEHPGTATVLNNLGVATIAGGILAPSIGYFYGSAALNTGGWWLMIAVAWFLIGAGLNIMAWAVLGRLKP